MIEISLFNYVSPIVVGTIFILLTGLIPEDRRRSFHSVVAAAASGTYLGGELGKLEPIFMVVMAASAFFGINNWKLVGLAWFLHGAVDLVHHSINSPLLFWYIPSSFECFIVDWYFAIYFLLDAPNLTARLINQDVGNNPSHPD
ncbi:MAG: hypothetical protein JGK17_15615 [Microcoleus sp. PH2017_10_PVI_O_A]|uniref:DUF6010 family protein n=1 Tax=unclassified Microcoleus TaxID=2642155 RepID=UPI001D21E60B|nr:MULTISPECIES: DUF6010 family protein [unclassified Microcoleus]TAE81705.1 MAG: hypothetical protein EAZ83_14490 [Oscillatoriales cyanobacterium]MCC3406988.1 hypothetical protein [Microcoleus sp. PH2017_10_PVI_O_A]MCC3461072.1 hypothetical protein [Microcoleus sp. PH2017_11_PCY_U_A]MCC3479589.1 hypothetical protein [Microcoleus sp. PH2017_12_PCY_D_A]MCC3530977.1 hypothetical protein [Microcoleus sp. PH2017_21_RUC_O_A]